MFAVKLSVLGRLGGIAGFMSAFLWSLILLGMLTPWQHILKDLQIFGSLYDGGLADIKSVKNLIVSGDLADKIMYYARFVAYPLITLLVWTMVQWKFARGLRESGPGAVSIVHTPQA